MKHTDSIETAEGTIPHALIECANGMTLRAPVKLQLRTKLNGKQAIMMMHDKRTSTYYPLPLHGEKGLVYARPGGGDYV